MFALCADQTSHFYEITLKWFSYWYICNFRNVVTLSLIRQLPKKYCYFCMKNGSGYPAATDCLFKAVVTHTNFTLCFAFRSLFSNALYQNGYEIYHYHVLELHCEAQNQVLDALSQLFEGKTQCKVDMWSHSLNIISLKTLSGALYWRLHCNLILLYLSEQHSFL